jgi:hypothetical protein
MLNEPKPAGLDRFRFARPGSSGVEQLTRNEQVAGSIPASGSIRSVLHTEQSLVAGGPSGADLVTP